MKNKRNNIKVRVDAEVWKQARSIFPNETDQSLSRIMFNTSLIRVENHLRNADFKDRLGEILHGKKVWKRK